MSGSGRPPRIRKDYMADAQTLLLLARAIDADPRLPDKWREDKIRLLRELSSALIEAPH